MRALQLALPLDASWPGCVRRGSGTTLSIAWAMVPNISVIQDAATWMLGSEIEAVRAASAETTGFCEATSAISPAVASMQGLERSRRRMGRQISCGRFHRRAFRRHLLTNASARTSACTSQLRSSRWLSGGPSRRVCETAVRSTRRRGAGPVIKTLAGETSCTAASSM
jgi:hypothetical protein